MNYLKNEIDVLNKHHELIQGIYSKEGLACLRGEKEDDYRFAGRSVYEWYFDTCNKIKDPEFEYQFVIDNLLFYSDEIMYFTANLILIKPFISDPEFSKIELNGKDIYPYDPNLADKRFNMFTEIIIEKIYAYWSQIALILKGYFLPQFPQKKVYFATILDEITKQKFASPNLDWLVKFKQDEFKLLNDKRKEIVHAASTDTKYRQAFLEKMNEPEELRRIIKERETLPSYFKTHIDNTLLGFEKTLDLINENLFNQ